MPARGTPIVTWSGQKQGHSCVSAVVRGEELHTPIQSPYWASLSTQRPSKTKGTWVCPPLCVGGGNRVCMH